MDGRGCREVIELRSIGLSFSKVAFLCGCSEAKASEVCGNARAIGLRWPVPVELTDDELARLVDPRKTALRFVPDYAALKGKLGDGRVDWDRAYGLYLEQAEGSGEDPYARSTFKERYSAWLATKGRPVKMSINWSPAEEIQTDWAGRKLQLHGEDDQVTPVFLFVATTPYSDYTFVRASLDMGMQAWLEHHVAMFEFFGGAPLWLAPDNLATGVVFKRGQRFVNLKYAELAAHYGCEVLPARVRTPTDKAAVESHVRIMANSIVGTLEQMEFTSIGQLNLAIAKLLDIYNDRPVPAFGGRSRREVFLTEEQGCLSPLPGSAFRPFTWRKVRVSADNVVAVRGNFYAVHDGYAGKKVFARITDGRVDVFDRKGGQCIASHPRGEDGAETFEGLPGVHPDRFKPLDEWCEAHGRMRILEQWDWQRNAGRAPHDYVCRSLKPVWWKCPECGFSWQEAPARRTKRTFDDCLACANVALVKGKNDLATLRPDIAAEWHPTRNGDLRADGVFADFCQQVWWLGACGHEWRAPISRRVRSHEGALCPYCSGKRALTGFNDVATLCPELAGMWHPSKNRNLTPDAVSVCFAREVYLWNGVLSHIFRVKPSKWLKENGYTSLVEPFERVVEEARIKDAEGDGFLGIEPIGKAKSSVKWPRFLKEAGLLVSFEEWCLAFGHEDLLDEWDAEKNGDLGPGDVTRASLERVWWKGACGHSWKVSVRMRVFRDAGCPYCDKREVLPGYNSVGCLKAELLQFWHPVKNGDLTPDMISDRTNKGIWWLCPECGYEWSESLRLTVELSRKCPACGAKRHGIHVIGRTDLKSVRPDIARQLHPEKNGGLRAEDLAAFSAQEVWWQAKCGHEWKESVAMRSARIDDSCPYCESRHLLTGFNDLAALRPDIAAEWHPSKNGALTPDMVRANSSRKAWWLGACGHEWDAVIARRAKDDGCPYCSGHRVLKGFNDLESQCPGIAAQWDLEKNGGLRPDQIVCGSARKIWWRCELGHSWRIAAFYRTNGHDTGCPYCGNRKVLKGFNDLRTTHPELARQWNRERNGKLKPTEVIANSCKRVWWKCELGHEWAVPISNRTRNPGHDPGCPYCHNRKVLPGFNDLATTHPEIAKEWNPYQNRDIKPTQVGAFSRKEVWWIAPCGHHFTLPVRNKAKAKPGYCCCCSGRKKPERPLKFHLRE